MICIYSKIKVYTVGHKLGATLGLYPTLTSQVAVLSPALMDTAWSLLALLLKAAVGTGEGLVRGDQKGAESWRGGWLSGCHQSPTLSPQSQLPHPFPNQYLKLTGSQKASGFVRVCRAQGCPETPRPTPWGFTCF